MRISFILLVLVLAASAAAQPMPHRPEFRVGLSAAYFRLAAIGGGGIEAEIMPGRKRGGLVLGFSALVGEGNPNVNMNRLMDPDVLESIEHRDYGPPFRFLGSGTSYIGFDEAATHVFARPLTAGVTQVSLRVGYQRRGHWGGHRWSLGAGLYGTSANVQYIMGVIEDLRFEHHPYDIYYEADWYVPQYVRYLDVAPYVTAQWAWPRATEKKVAWGLRLAWQAGFYRNDVFTLGAFAGLPW